MTTTTTAKKNIHVVASPRTVELRNKIIDAKKQLNAAFPERREVIDLLFAALIGGEHILLLGEPGTAKSALINTFTRIIEGAREFSYLMTRFTEPSEIMGSVDVKLLSETGRQKFVSAGRLPEAEVAFLDEVFKSNSAVLNALLTMINERRYFDDGAWHKAALEFLAAASNEVPEAGDTSVQAFYDRILVRYVVHALDNDDNADLLMDRALPPVGTNILKLDDIRYAREESSKLPLDEATKKAVKAIRRLARTSGILVSDRRIFVQAMNLLRAHAWINGAESVGHGAVALLKHVLWAQPQQIPQVEEIVKKHAPSWETELTSIRKVLDEQQAMFGRIDSMPTKQAAMEALGGIQDVLDEKRADLDKLVEKYPEALDSAEMLRKMAKEIEDRSVTVSVAVRTKKFKG